MPVTHICENCGKEFQTCPSYRGRYCGKECAGSMNRRHGVSLTQEYAVWKHMRNRCNNPKCRDYPRYGGRGIKVDPRWDVYENFREDMGPRPSRKHSIERIDNDRGYGPDNCKWATKLEQSRNRSNVILKPENLEKIRLHPEIPASELAAEFGCSTASIYRARKLSHSSTMLGPEVKS